MKKLSIIVPIYNSEMYIRRCIESVLNQKYKNIELILIDDGSKDNSVKICREYANLYGNIIFISKKNEGPGPTRNKGLEIATGDYIGFLDSDDYIHEDMYFKMIEEAEKNNADIVQCDYYKTSEEGNIIQVKNPTSIDNQIEIEGNYNCSLEYVKRKLINPYLCSKVFNKELFSGVTMPPLFFAEDQCALAQLFYNCEKLIILPEPYYYYVTNPEGLYHSEFNEKQLDSIEASKFIYDFYIDKYENLAPFYALKICYYIAIFYWPLKRSNIMDKDRILSEMHLDFKYYFNCFKDSEAIKYTAKKRIGLLKLSKLNLPLGSFIYNFYDKMK